ncbi:MAG: hypothetical protein KDB54_05165 [Solirubrobacterales bacterium]|nr:hypothetical protein [Solirubrobacterales bacterium]
MSAATGSEALERLAARVREEGPPLTVKESPARPMAGDPRYGELAATGPRTRGKAGEYAFVVEAVREGYLCHYGTSRILDDPDPDLALLAGDLFYAIGIRGLADLDDLESTGILSDLIRVAAGLQAAGRPDLAEVVWLGQIVALACGKDADQQAAVSGLEHGRDGAAGALAEWSARSAATSGMGREFDFAQTAIDSRPSNL